jgi:hypothetical protein
LKEIGHNLIEKAVTNVKDEKIDDQESLGPQQLNQGKLKRAMTERINDQLQIEHEIDYSG